MRRGVRARSRLLVCPPDAAVHAKAARAQLVFLPLAVALPRRAALAVKDHPRRTIDDVYTRTIIGFAVPQRPRPLVLYGSEIQAQTLEIALLAGG